MICCCGAAWRALTSAVTIAVTSRPEPMPAELMVPLPVLVVPEDELLEEPLVDPVLVFDVSELSSDDRLLAVEDVALVVMTVPFQIPEWSPPCGEGFRAPGKILVVQGLCRWLPWYPAGR